jgi:Secretion system C-terminal sorting domain
MCTFFALLGVHSIATAQFQCQQDGLSLSFSSSFTNVGTTTNLIPFCTPITLTATVTNTKPFSQNVNVKIRFNRFVYSLLCMDDFNQDCSVSGSNIMMLCLNNVSIGAGQTRTFSLRVQNSVLQGTVLVGGDEHIFSELAASSNPTNTCVVRAFTPALRFASATILGTPGQTTVVNNFPAVSPTSSLVIRGNVVLNFDHTVNIGNPLNPLGNFIGMDNGATLTIPNGRTLTLQGTNVYGCTTMWNSIVVESGGSLVTTAGNGSLTTIQDGFRAIEAQPNSTVNIFQTTFRDNSTSLYVAPTGSPQGFNFGSFFGCVFEGTGTLKAPMGTICNFDRVYGFPYAGFDVNDVSSLQVLFAPNIVRTRFRNLSNGILTNRTGLFINQVKFENIKEDFAGQGGIGVRVSGANAWLLAAGQNDVNNLDFNNCSVGIQCDNMGGFRLAQMSGITMDNRADNNGIGVFAINNTNMDAWIYGNDIKSRLGIASLFNHPSTAEIYNNIIEATFPNNPSISGGIYAYENSSTGNWNIHENLITVQNAQFGVHFNSGNNAIVRGNIVGIEPYSTSTSKGFYSGGSFNFNVSCNEFSVNGSTPSFYDRSGMYMVNGSGSFYNCNSTNSTQTGLNIIGNCQPFSMLGNGFGRHGYGLVLNNQTFIGVQNIKGNRWVGPFTNLGAQHLDPDNNDVAQSRFDVGSPNAPIMPTFSPSGWFNLVGGTDRTCGSPTACFNIAGRIAAPSTDNNDAFYRTAINDATDETPYAKEMKWTAQRNAYGRLMDNPTEQNGRDMADFMGRKRATGLGQLYQVEKSMKDMHGIGEEFSTILTPNMASIKALANEVADLDVKVVGTKDKTAKAALVAQKKEKNARIQSLTLESAPHQATIQRKKQQECARLLRDNEAVSARLQPETNEKDVNKIYLQTVAQGKMTLNSQQKETVKLIAYQCPQQGGNAVFAARSLYSLVEKVNFDDLELCSLSSTIVQGLAIKKRVETFKISPNPATDVLSVSKSSEQTKGGEWLVFDTAGKLLLSKQVSENEIDATINIQHLSEGVYFVSFSVNGHKQFTQKIIKIKSN